MSTYERYGIWYSPWPAIGIPSNRQIDHIRWDTEDIKAAARSSLLDIDDSAPYYQSEKVQKGVGVGRVGFKNKFRLYYAKEGSYYYFKIQLNTGTIITPNWVDIMKVEESIGHVTFGTGGVRSLGGWYG